MSYIQAHPFKSVFHVINIVTFFTLAVAGGPFFYSSGFVRLGTKALSITSLFQSIFCNDAIRSSFAYLQIAAMSEYRLGLLHTAVRSVSGIGSVVEFFWGSKSIRMNNTWASLQDFVGYVSFCALLALLFCVLVKIGSMGYKVLHGVIRPAHIHTEQELREARE